MMKGAAFKAAAALVFIGLYGLPAAAVIFDQDNRVDYPEVKNEKHRRLMDSSVALFAAGAVSLDSLGWARLATRPFDDTNGYSPKERFYGQPMGPFCSGALVAPDLVLTAKHCLDDFPCGAIKLVFGYRTSLDGAFPSFVARGEVFSCEKVIRVRKKGYAATALVRLDRSANAKAHPPIAVHDNSGENLTGREMFYIGYPMGLTVKFVDGFKVIIDRPSPNLPFIFADADAYAASSGSPVFDLSTGQIQGVLAGKPILPDFVKDKSGLMASKVVATKPMVGELSFIATSSEFCETLRNP
ncbi:MAG: trypsin-like peptidase domain-containing protein [Elusimicrobia bacterium]|nr:trypsin-like peptidase domain-containing protein [Elusimicrobiota bacterium]